MTIFFCQCHQKHAGIPHFTGAFVLRWWDDEVTPMLLVADSAELRLRAGWRVRATIYGAVSGSTQLVLEVCVCSKHLTA